MTKTQKKKEFSERMPKTSAALRAWIPQRVSNKMVLRVLELMRRWQRLKRGLMRPGKYGIADQQKRQAVLPERHGVPGQQSRAEASPERHGVPKAVGKRQRHTLKPRRQYMDYSAHMEINRHAMLAHVARIRRDNGYIEDQNRYTDMVYGKTTMQYAGCEIFAVYNAIRSLYGRCRADLPNLICAFERDGMVLDGRFGTTPKAIYDYMKQNGFHAAMTTNEAQFDALARKYQTLILTFYNDRYDIAQKVHTVNITKKENGYVAHNVYCNGRVVGPYPDIRTMLQKIHGGRAGVIALIGISKHANKEQAREGSG